MSSKKKVWKVTGWIVLFTLLFFVILITVASFSQNKIVDVAMKKVSESLNATVEVGDVSLTLIKRFPYATLEFNHVRLSAAESSLKTDSATTEDVINLDHVFVSFKTRPLFNGIYEIAKVEVEGASLNCTVDSLGHTNLDFLMDTTQYVDTTITVTPATTALPLVTINDLQLKKIRLRYSDAQNQIAATLTIPNLQLNGDFNEDTYQGQVAGKMELSRCSYGNTRLSLMQLSTCDFDLQYLDDTLLIHNFNITTDGAHMNAKGKAAVMDDLFVDIVFGSDGLNLDELIKYAPTEMLDTFGIEQLAGQFLFSGHIKGQVTDSILPWVSVAYELKEGYLKTRDYPTMETLEIKGDFTNGDERNNSTSVANIQSFLAATKKSRISASAWVSNLDAPVYDLTAQTKVNLKEFVDFVPDTLVQNLSGDFSGTLKTFGQWKDTVDNAFIEAAYKNSRMNLTASNIAFAMDTLEVQGLSGNCSFHAGKAILNNFTITIPTYQTSLQNTSFDINLIGKPTDVDHMAVQVNSFNLEAPQGKINGKGSVKNFDHPVFTLNTTAILFLDQLQPFVPDNLVTNLAGEIHANLSTYGTIHLDSMEAQMPEIVFHQSELEMKLSDINAHLVESALDFSMDKGWARLANDSLQIKNTSGVVADIDFSVDSTYVSNAYQAVLLNNPDTLKAFSILKLGDINHEKLATLLKFMPEETDSLNQEQETDSITPVIPRYLTQAKGKFSVRSFTYDHALIDQVVRLAELDDSTTILLHSSLKDKFVIEDISTKYSYEDSLVLIDEFNFKAFDGDFSNSVRVDFKPGDEMHIHIKNLAEHLDVNKLLYNCNSFGQDTLISYQNLKGHLQYEIHSESVIKADEFLDDKLRVKGNFTLRDGAIVNFKPAMQLSSKTSLKELDNIQFKSVNTKLFVTKQKIYVPETYLVSPTMDANILAMHSLISDYEYHALVHLQDILLGKRDKIIKEQADAATEIDGSGRRGYNLIYADIEGNKRVGFLINKKSKKDLSREIKTQEALLNLNFYPGVISYKTGIK